MKSIDVEKAPANRALSVRVREELARQPLLPAAVKGLIQEMASTLEIVGGTARRVWQIYGDLDDLNRRVERVTRACNLEPIPRDRTAESAAAAEAAARPGVDDLVRRLREAAWRGKPEGHQMLATSELTDAADLIEKYILHQPGADAAPSIEDRPWPIPKT